MRKRNFPIPSGLMLGAGLSLGVVQLAFLWGLIPGHDLGRASAYLREVMQIVNENYVDPGAATYDKLAHNAMHGMVESLDPHSEYMESQDNSDLEEDLSGEFGGVGLNVEIHAGKIQVIAPVAGSPGDRAGIRHGDQIMSIDGRLVAAPATMDEVVTRLRGKPKTSVAVGLFRPATGQNLKVTLVREIIKVDSVVGARVLGDGVGYLAITEFSEHTGEQFDHALDGLLKQNIGSLIIDLRNNPGGLLDAAVDVAEPFFRKGELIVYTQGRKPADREDFRADSDGDPLNLPLAVLINCDTASAAEIVTGALKDTGRAVIVGERSFGKGSVQSIFKLKSGEGLRLTTAHYYTPSGVTIHGQGITPQVEVVMTADEDAELMQLTSRPDLTDPKEIAAVLGFAPIEDRQLAAAVDVLKGVEVLDDQAEHSAQRHDKVGASLSRRTRTGETRFFSGLPRPGVG